MEKKKNTKAKDQQYQICLLNAFGVIHGEPVELKGNSINIIMAGPDWSTSYF